MLPKGFLDGGAVGIALLINSLANIDVSILIVLVNVPFIILGTKVLNKMFIIRSVIAISGLAIAVNLIPYPQITSDPLLIAVFGGFFLGSGIGFAIKGHSVIDGTEVLALYLTRNSAFSIGDVIGLLNVVIFSFAAILIDIEIALYAMLTYLAASRTIDFVIHGVDEYLDLKIISSMNEEIRSLLVNKLGKGVTILKGKRGLKDAEGNEIELDILYVVTTKLEVSKLKSEIEKVDPKAFIIQSRIDETKGGFLKKQMTVH